MTMTSNSTSQPRARRIEFDALFNFRDLGGYLAQGGMTTTRWGLLYRSDGLHRATSRDLDRLEELGVATVVDLRTGHERIEDGSFDEVQTRISYHHVPLFEDLAGERPDPEGDDYLLRLYMHMVTARGARIAQAISAVGTSDQPLVFHCTAGKDRTGVVAALVLAAVGVSDDVIAQDYALSHDAMEALVAWYRNKRQGDAPTPIQTAAALNLLGAEAGLMHQMLTLIRAEHGSIDEYLRFIGVDSSDLIALRTKFLD